MREKSISQHFVDHLLCHIPDDKNTRILDIGCGYGKNLIELQEYGYQNAVGVDISKQQVEFAKDLGCKNVILKDPILYLDEANELFDVVLLIDLVEHLELEYLIDLLQKIDTKLSPNGCILMQTPNGMSPMSPFIYADLTHVRAYTPQSLRQLCRLSGLPDPSVYALYPTKAGANRLRRVIWKTVLNPLIKAFLLGAHGGTYGGIYTGNILAKVEKQKTFRSSQSRSS